MAANWKGSDGRIHRSRGQCDPDLANGYVAVSALRELETEWRKYLASDKGRADGSPYRDGYRDGARDVLTDLARLLPPEA